MGAPPRRRARRGAPALPRPRDRQRAGDPRPHPARVRQGAHPRLRGGARRRHPGALLRAHCAGVPAAAPRQGALPAPHDDARVHHRPRGVVGVIAPWNYPFTLAIGDALPALVAGNGVVLKPDAQTPFTGLWAAGLLEEAGLPAGLLQVVTGRGAELGGPLIDGDRLHHVHGLHRDRPLRRRPVRRAAQELRHGARRQERAARPAGRAAAGAPCPAPCRASRPTAGSSASASSASTSTTRVYDAFVPRLAEALQGRPARGRASRSPTTWARWPARTSSTRCAAHVDDAVAKGAEVLAGGRARPDLGPVLLRADVARRRDRQTWSCAAPRPSAPSRPSIAAASVDEMVARANDSEYGLNASVWTRDVKAGRDVAARLEAGTVERQRGLRRDVGLGGADGRLEAVRPRPPARPPRPGEVHGVADRRRGARAQHRHATVPGPRPVRGGHDQRSACSSTSRASSDEEASDDDDPQQARPGHRRGLGHRPPRWCSAAPRWAPPSRSGTWTPTAPSASPPRPRSCGAAGARAFACDVGDREQVYARAGRGAAAAGESTSSSTTPASSAAGPCSSCPTSDRAHLRRQHAVALLGDEGVPAGDDRPRERSHRDRGLGRGPDRHARETDYAASKFAAVGFNEALRQELRRSAPGVKTTSSARTTSTRACSPA